MPDFSPDDWKLIAEYVKAEKERRAQHSKRKEKERIWKEVDRQIRMEPIPVKLPPGAGNKFDWYSELELSLQAQTLEVIQADSRRLRFPRGTAWFQAKAELSDIYIRRFEERRFNTAMLGDLPVPMKIDQETADTLVHATMDHYHRLHDFRARCDLLDAEMIKYGTCVARVREVRRFNDFRYGVSRETRGPALIPCSIKNVFLDHSAALTMHEGEAIEPSFIENYWQVLEDVKRAARMGGKERGWRMAWINRLVANEAPDEHKGQVEILEFEGDLIVPKNRNPLFLPNVRVRVAVGKNGPDVIRFQENPAPFRSYIVGHYMREDVSDPYGSSPLMKGQPLAEACCAAMNDMMAVSRLNALPPISYDASDSRLTAAGGPTVHPQAQWATDAPNAIQPHQIGKLSDSIQLFATLLKMYEDETGVNDPRRGAEVKSHTTATHMDIQSTKGLSRTDDFVTSNNQGMMTTILHMQYAIAKMVMKPPVSMSIDANGIDGWAKVGSEDLPDGVVFEVNGAAGVLQERERAENFLLGITKALEITGLGLQLQTQGLVVTVPIPDLHQMVLEVLSRAGVENPDRFVPGQQGLPEPAMGQPPLGGPDQGAMGAAPPPQAMAA